MLEQMYRTERKLGWNASTALRNAKTRIEWDSLNGETVDNYDTAPGTVRLKIVADDMGHDDSYIDTWDISETENQRVKQDLWARIESDGVWGVIGEYYDGHEWQHADSCFDFIGADWENSGHDTDIMQSAIDAYKANAALVH